MEYENTGRDPYHNPGGILQSISSHSMNQKVWFCKHKTKLCTCFSSGLYGSTKEPSLMTSSSRMDPLSPAPVMMMQKIGITHQMPFQIDIPPSLMGCIDAHFLDEIGDRDGPSVLSGYHCQKLQCSYYLLRVAKKCMNDMEEVWLEDDDMWNTKGGKEQHLGFQRGPPPQY